jgi:nucleoside 2-deoxyribosyltransferase
MRRKRVGDERGYRSFVMPSAPCAIWGTPAERWEKAGDFEVFDSPRAGGRYWISGTAIAQVGTLTDHAKRLLTTWLCEQRRAGVDLPQIDSKVIDLIRARKPLSVTTRLNHSLRFFGRQIQELGALLQISGETDTITLRFLAETESKNKVEVAGLLTMLHSAGDLEGTFFIGGGASLRPTMTGWSRIEELSQPQTDSSQAFVAMWFHDSTTEAYVKGIAPAVIATGYKPVRIDSKEHNNKIDDEIIAEIRRSRFLVADFTCEPKNARGGVYYESGFAQGLGIPVIWTCKDTSIDDLHFDTRQYAHIVWKDPADLFVKLKNRIGATIGDGPLPRS